MKNKYHEMPKLITSFLTALIFLAACTGPSQSEEKDPDTRRDTVEIKPPIVTILADLPQDRQPKITLLTQAPPPNEIKIPVQKEDGRTYYAGSGMAKMEPPKRIWLPSLKNNTGQLILDPTGKPYILGNGGLSNFTNYNTDDGLPSGEVLATYLDRSGFLWIGTREGVCRYDGLSFTTYTMDHGLADNDVRCILQDRDGNLWFGGRGISRFDGHNFATFKKDQGLAGNGAYSIIEDTGGNIWFVGDQGLSRFDGESFTSFPHIVYTNWEGNTDRIFHSLVEDRKGYIWLATNGGGVIRFDPNEETFKTYSTKEGLNRPWVRGMILDKNGYIWMGTFGGGVYRLDPKQEIFTNYTIKDGLAGDMVQSITEDQSGILWFGTNGGGLSRFDGEAFTTFTTDQGLAGNRVWSITDDGAGHLWLATRDGGLSRYDGAAFTRFTTEHGLGNNIIWSIAEDRMGQLWFGMPGQGVSRFDGQSFTNYTGAQGLGIGGNGILSIIEDRKGSIWLGTMCCGVSRFNGDTFTTYSKKQGLPQQVVSSIYEDRKGIFWFGITGQGVSRFDGQSFTNYNLPQGLAGNMISSITEDEFGGIWFGTPGRGISRFDGQSFTNFTTEQGLVNNTVFSITRDKDGNLWFGTQGGVSYVSNEKIKDLWGEENEKINYSKVSISLFKSITDENGLKGNAIKKILELPNGKMVSGTKQGIILFDPPSETPGDSFLLKNISVFNSSNGYPIKDVNKLFLDSEENLWIASSDNKVALVRFDYDKALLNERLPSLSLRQIQIGNVTIPWNSLTRDPHAIEIDSLTHPSHLTEETLIFGKPMGLKERALFQETYKGVRFDDLTPFRSIPQKLSLPYRHNQLTIHFGSTELATADLLDFQYKLEGYDRDWSPPSKGTSASFGNIREGQYTFKLRAQYTGPSRPGASEWTDPLEYTFRVRPPWHRTWWAYLVFLLFFGTSIYLLFQWRTRALRQRAEALEKTVAERTAEVVAQKEVIEKEKERSDELLLNILPAETAEELKQNGSAAAKDYDQVTVLFTDFKDFTKVAEKLTPKELVAEIDHCYQAFDRIMEEHNVEKIKTIGDAYMAAAGLPSPSADNPVDALRAAFAVRDFMEKYHAQREGNGQEGFRIRIGLHTGPVVAGIVGIKKFAYDIWGDTVNTAARMESSGEVGKVNISQATYQALKENPEFTFTSRGKIKAKNKGEVEMYFVEMKN